MGAWAKVVPMKVVNAMVQKVLAILVICANLLLLLVI
jgi:hypothetical protein